MENKNGSFVCRNGGLPLEQFPCFYSGNSVKPEVKCGMTDIASNTLHNPEDFRTEDNDLAVIIGAALGVVIVIQALAICFLLFQKYKSKTGHESIDWYIPETTDLFAPVLIKRLSGNENEASEQFQCQEIDLSDERSRFGRKPGGHYQMKKFDG
ncbi:uncharacterized protein LOC112567442 isoform X2 [Pomacea canaliculata]|uniref:uncharacterized protein LOC112567442 isoform X2 n=1 Tax=Pomacea canaliculata TaxID=400727 RepID=UPI000D72B0A8|nr:uncharacterized protein LOC112567442 isoform X2 [Pomacea canaliculata]